MKLILLLSFSIAVLLQGGCATGPSINQRSLQNQQDSQAAKKSTEFAKTLGQ
jgi:hypothetical protein